MKTRRILLISAIFLFGCQSDEEAQTSRASLATEEGSSKIKYVSVKSPKGTRGQWLKAWSKEVGKAIDLHSKELVTGVTLPQADLQRINCLGFNNARENDKKRFWALFLSSISLFETDFNPNTRYWERGMNVWSERLFQLSVSTSRYHYGCEDLSSSNILQPSSNISCAVAVLRNQIRKKGALFPLNPYYWSVLSSSKKYKVQNFFKSQMAELSFCR